MTPTQIDHHYLYRQQLPFQQLSPKGAECVFNHIVALSSRWSEGQSALRFIS